MINVPIISQLCDEKDCYKTAHVKITGAAVTGKKGVRYACTDHVKKQEPPKQKELFK